MIRINLIPKDSKKERARVVDAGRYLRNRKARIADSTARKHRKLVAKKAAIAAYAAAHPEEVLAREAEANAIRAQKKKASDAAYYTSHRIIHLAQSAEYAKKYPEKIRATNARYRAAHPEIVAARAVRDRKAHPEVAQNALAARRARKRNAPVNDFTAAQWRELQAACNHRCAYCGKRAKGHLTQDHITPLIKGGAHTLVNIIPACGSCNSRKHAGSPLVPVQPFLITVAPSRKKSSKN